MVAFALCFIDVLLFIAPTLCASDVESPAEYVSVAGVDDPPGHLKPLGSHRPPESPIDVIDYTPDPVWFYENYVKLGKPLLMKGQATKIPAFHLWTDDYLRDNFGKTLTTVETKKKETRDPNDGLYVKLSTFLDYYRHKTIYMVQDLTPEMMKDFHLLKCLLCGGFTEFLNTAVMWFSSGGTKSVLHNDNIDNINCIFQGAKDFVFIDRKHKDAIEGTKFVHDKGYSEVDVESVDMYKFPNLRDIPWYKARMEKGDCFFIPMYWYHHVHSFGDTRRNLAINIWFSHLFWFNHTDCDVKKPLPETQALSDFKMASRAEMQRNILLIPFEGLQVVTFEEFRAVLVQLFPSLEEDDATLEEMFGFIDSDKDGIVTWPELQYFDMEAALDYFPGLFDDPEQAEDDDRDDGKLDEAHEAEETVKDEL